MTITGGTQYSSVPLIFLTEISLWSYKSCGIFLFCSVQYHCPALLQRNFQSKSSRLKSSANLIKLLN
jgi:hypothetical protein